MELKTKYQYTYFVYPFVILKKDYKNFISRIVIDKNWNIKLYDKTQNAEIDAHFLSIAKNEMFPTLKWTKEYKDKFNKMNAKNKSKVLSTMRCTTFEYNFDSSTKGRVGTDDAIFFEIPSIKLMCFNDGICFLLIKAELEEKDYISFNKILNFNYKFRNVTPKFMKLNDYEYIKIQTDKFDTAEDIREFMKKICIGYEDESLQDIYTNRLFVYTYACLDESEWNSTNDFERIKSEFLKYKYVLSGDYTSEFSDGIENENTYSRWKYSMYGFTKMSGVVFSSAVDHFNFTKLPFYFENVYMYIMLYAFYQRMKYMVILKNICNIKSKKILKEKLFSVINSNSFTQITNSEHGMTLWEKWREIFALNEMREEIIKQYEILK